MYPVLSHEYISAFLLCKHAAYYSSPCYPLHGLHRLTQALRSLSKTIRFKIRECLNKILRNFKGLLRNSMRGIVCRSNEWTNSFYEQGCPGEPNWKMVPSL